jgi:ubiquinone/menaquinone biosynthesis C-methylase UbiE
MKRGSPGRPRSTEDEAQSWEATPPLSRDELPPDAWFRGYFATEDHLEGPWRKDLGELRQRDAALFALGEVSGRRVLDVACGGGLYLVVLAMMGAEVAGQDLSEDRIDQARHALIRHGLTGELVPGDATRLHFDNDRFDAIISGDFLEHISLAQKRRFLGEAYRVLRPGGLLVLKTPNLSYLRVSVWFRRMRALLAGRSPFGVHIAHTRGNPDFEHHGLMTRGQLERLLAEYPFHEVEFLTQPLAKPPLPRWLQKTLPRLPLAGTLFDRDIIARTRKSLFLGYFP